MNLTKVVIELSASEVKDVLRIDLDEDAMEALAFIKGKIAKQVKKSLQPH